MTVPLIGLAHGSRHPAGSAAIEDLLAETARLGAVETQPAYLDLAEPDLDAAAGALAAAGHPPAVVVPLLFTAAFHATIDVPRGRTRRRGQHPGSSSCWPTSSAPATTSSPCCAPPWPTPGSGRTPRCCCSRSAPPTRPPTRRSPTWPTGWRPTGPRPVGRRSATCDPRPDDGRSPSWTSRSPIVPLFLADGLLLDPVRTLAAERGWTMTEPLGERAAGVVLDRYRSHWRRRLLDRF